MTSRRDFLALSLGTLAAPAAIGGALWTPTLHAQDTPPPPTTAAPTTAVPTTAAPTTATTEIPESNRASLTEPPRRPALGDVTDRMRRLLMESCVPDAPAPSHELFLSREAFALIKAISDPNALYDRIFRAYDEDIHELHARLLTESRGDLTQVAFTGFRFTGRRGWVRLREETNRLPYWAQRHSFLEYTILGRPHQIEVRTMIAWGDRWFITHLNEFR